MVKRGSLNKVEKFSIEGHSELPIEDIAAELDRSVNIVKKYLDTLPEEKPTQPATPVKPKKNETRFLQNMGRYERAGEKVATVMTGNASEEADRTRPSRIANKKIQESIHKPRG